MQTMTIGLVLFLIATSGPLLALVQAQQPETNAPVLVIGRDVAAQVSLAGGYVIGPQVAPFAVLASGEAAFISELDQSDTWYARDGTWLAALCGVKV